MEFNGDSAGIPLVYSYPSGVGGLIGQTVTIPDGHVGIVSAPKGGTDTLNPGTHVISAEVLPHLRQALNLTPGQPAARTPPLALRIVRTVTTDYAWTARPLVSRNARDGMTCCDLHGTVSVSIHVPAAFVGMLSVSVNRISKKISPTLRKGLKTMSPDQQAKLLIHHAATSAATSIFASRDVAACDLPHEMALIHAALSQGITERLAQFNMQCQKVTIDAIPQAMRTPCAGCGSTSAPTAYGIFRRNISLLYIRFGSKRDGNFCIKCALFTSAIDNVIMLACGWWGIVGLFLTPVYFAQNCYNAGRIVFGHKVAAAEWGAVALSTGDVWPPAPETWRGGSEHI